MRAKWSTTSGWYIIGWALCAKSVMAVCPPHQRPSDTMGRRTANPQGKEAWTSHPHWHDHQQEVYEVNLSKTATWMEDSREILAYLRLPIQG